MARYTIAETYDEAFLLLALHEGVYICTDASVYTILSIHTC